MTEDEGHWTMTREAMLDLINEKRRDCDRSPIDHNTMITRLVLRSKVFCPDVFDFRATQLTLSPETLPILEDLMNEQFDLTLHDAFKRHATFHPPRSQPTELGGSSATLPESPRGIPVESTDGSILERLKRLFGFGR